MPYYLETVLVERTTSLFVFYVYAHDILLICIWQNTNPKYPTAIVTPDQEAQVAVALRTLLDNNGFHGVKIVGYVCSYPRCV